MLLFSTSLDFKCRTSSLMLQLWLRLLLGTLVENLTRWGAHMVISRIKLNLRIFGLHHAARVLLDGGLELFDRRPDWIVLHTWGAMNLIIDTGLDIKDRGFFCWSWLGSGKKLMRMLGLFHQVLLVHHYILLTSFTIVWGIESRTALIWLSTTLLPGFGHEEVFRYVGIFISLFRHFVDLDKPSALLCLPFLYSLPQLGQKALKIGHILDFIGKILLKL